MKKKEMVCLAEELIQDAQTGVTGLTRELSVLTDIGRKVPCLSAEQVGVADLLNASPSICRMARTMMSKLFLGLLSVHGRRSVQIT